MFPEFNHKAAELSAYTFTIDTFIISLKNGTLTHFIPKDKEAFIAWLTKNRIRDIRKDDGTKKA